jgi:hypothetical protein
MRKGMIVGDAPVTWPMRVLKAKDTMVAIETPLERVRVSNISAGMIQDKGPQVAEKEKLYSQVLVAVRFK